VLSSGGNVIPAARHVEKSDNLAFRFIILAELNAGLAELKADA